MFAKMAIKEKKTGFLGRSFMTVAALIAAGLGPTPSTTSFAQGNGSTTVNQTTEQKQAPITNPVPIRAARQTAIGTARPPRPKKLLYGAIPQKHAPRHTNRLHSSKKAKAKAKRKAR